MKKYISLLVFFFFLFKGISQNIITNGDFELGTNAICACANSFTCNNDAGRVVDGIHPLFTVGNGGCMGASNYTNSQGAHSGTSYVYFYAGFDNIRTNSINFPADTIIDICVWYTGPQGNGAPGQGTANAHFSFGIDGVQVGPDIQVPTNTPWTQFCYSANILAGNHTIDILSGGFAQYSLWFDDFSATYPIAQTTLCKETYNWIFGSNAGVTFMGAAQPTPSVLTGSAMNMNEGCASISDQNGNLLFYTNGEDAWDASNTITPNGTLLAGGGMSAQSSIIVPLPQSNSLYYIFTVKDWTTAQNGIGFNYSILDVNLPGNGTSANPLGDIDVNNKNIPIDSNVREQVTAIYHENCEDIWIVTHRGSKWHSSDKYLAYLLTSTGLNTTPVISSVGMTYYTNNRFGYLKPSHNGKKICTTLGRGASGSNFNGTTVELLDFSNSTGVVSNPIVIADNVSTVNAYSSEFSPDNNILYVVGFDGTFIDQYDLSSGIQNTIVASKTNVATGNAVKSCLQLGPDNKIYVARNGTNYLGVIDDPNSLLNCNYIDQAVNLGNGSAKLGLPTFWKRQNTQIFSNVAICQGDSIFVGGAYQNTTGTYNDTTYGTSICAGCDSILTTNLMVNSQASSSTSLTICDNQIPFSWNGLTFNATGSQSAVLTSAYNCDSIATLNLTVNPIITNTINLTICDNQLPYSWNGLIFNGSSSQSVTLSSTSNCDSIATLNLTVSSVLTNTINITICDDQLPYSWNGLTFNASGSQSVTLTSSIGCDSIITLNLTVNAIPIVTFNSNIQSGCSPLQLTLTADYISSSADYIWDIGGDLFQSGDSISFTLVQAGYYDVTLSITDNGCYNTVTIPSYFYVEDNPQALFTPSINVFEELSQEVTFINNSIGANSYLWVFGNGSTSTDIDPTVLFTNTTNGYNVLLLAYSNLNCIDSLLINIPFQESLIFYVPNTFTPDGDMLNQTFRPVFTSGFDPGQFSMSIYNRWGELIFVTHDADIGWNGSYGMNGNKVIDGVYTYHIMYKTPSVDVRRIVSGHVNLIK